MLPQLKHLLSMLCHVRMYSHIAFIRHISTIRTVCVYVRVAVVHYTVRYPRGELPLPKTLSWPALDVFFFLLLLRFLFTAGLLGDSCSLLPCVLRSCDIRAYIRGNIVYCSGILTRGAEPLGVLGFWHPRKSEWVDKGASVMPRTCLTVGPRLLEC
jgi:hypothetical protein